MGVQTPITLQEVQELFPTLKIITLEPTIDGIIDTTYLVHTSNNSFILKRYEQKTNTQINTHLNILHKLHLCKLDTPRFITESKGWYLFHFTKGNYLSTVDYSSLKKIARALQQMHKCTRQHFCDRDISERININKALQNQKKYYYHYKRFLPLKKIPKNNDGIIHGDIFFDNILENDNKIYFLDFSDAANGRFSFDLAVILSSLCSHPQRQHYINFLLHVYNQNNSFKVTKKELLSDLKYAKLFYDLLKRDLNKL